MEEIDRVGSKVIRLLHELGMIRIYPKDKKDGWILHSGIWSPFYIQMRPLFSKNNSKLVMDVIGDAMKVLIEKNYGGKDNITKLVGVASAGIPISVIVSYKTEIPLCYTRRICDKKTLQELEKACKGPRPEHRNFNDYDYGEHSWLEGHLEDGDNLLLIDDLITNGESKLIAKKQVEFEAMNQNKKVKCDNVAVIVDREQGGKEELKKQGISLCSLVPFKSKGILWLKDRMESSSFELINDYLKDPKKYQDQRIRQEILKGI